MIEADRVVDALGYERSDHNECVLNVTAVRFARRSKDEVVGHPKSSLGSLAPLPVEIVQQIFEYLEASTFLSVRLLNRLTCEVVDHSSKFRTLRKHAAAALRAVVLSQLTCYTISDIYAVLTRPECAMCGAFGSFLHLPSCSRCCFACVRDQLDLLPSVLTISDRLSQLDLADFARADRPGMRSLPGNYSMCHHARHCIVDQGGFTLLYKPQMRNKNARLDSYLVAMDARDGRVEIQKKMDRREREAAHAVGFDGTVMEGDEIPPCNTLRTLMAVTPMPFLDSASGRVQRGLSCKGCYAIAASASQSGFLGARGARIDRVFTSNNVYSDHELQDHVNQCIGGQLLCERWSAAGSFPTPVPQRVGIQFQRELWSLTCFNLAPPGSVAIADYS